MVTIDELRDQIRSLESQLNSLEATDVKESSKDSELRIVPDSSWLVAILDEKDTHHTSTQSSLGALLPYKPVFYIPALVYLEVMSRLVRVNKVSVKKCYLKIQKFLNKISYKHSTNLQISQILEKYKTYSRVKISKLRPLDFYIVTDGLSLGAKILTCDLEMYYYTKKYYKNIYFMTDKVKNKGSDLAELIKDIQSNK